MSSKYQIPEILICQKQRVESPAWDMWFELEDACARKLVFNIVAPLGAFFVYKTLSSLRKKRSLSFALDDSSTGQASHLMTDGTEINRRGNQIKDNRVWIGPTVIATMVIQLLCLCVVALSKILECYNMGIIAVDECISQVMVAVMWMAVLWVAIRQVQRFARSDTTQGLFGVPVVAFVSMQLACDVAVLYFALFAPAQANAPFWQEHVVIAKCAMESILVALFLVTNRAAPTGYQHIGAFGEVYNRHGKRSLSVGSERKPESAETCMSILDNSYYNWLNGLIDIACARQIQQSDLLMPPKRLHPAKSWESKFSRVAKSRRPLFVKLFVAFRADAILLLLLTTMKATFAYLRPFFLQHILRAIDDQRSEEANLRTAYFVACAMLVCNVAASIIEQARNWVSRTAAMQIRNTVVCLLARKSLNRAVSEPTNRSGASDGRAFNILTSDVAKTTYFTSAVEFFIEFPVRLLIGALYIYVLLGAAGLAGIAALSGSLVGFWVLIKRSQRIEFALSRVKDTRIAWLSEIIRGMASVKLFGWGSQFTTVVNNTRTRELALLWDRELNWAVTNMWSLCSLPVANFAAFSVFSMFGTLTPEITFTTIAVLGVLKETLNIIPYGGGNTVNFYVAIRRIEAFLEDPEIQPLNSTPDYSHGIGFEGADFVWRDCAQDPFALRDLSVRFAPGTLSLVCGATGSGKSSLLSALLGEMRCERGKLFIPSHTTSPILHNLATRSQSSIADIAYVPQEPWLRNTTVRENILFGEPYDVVRYEAVLNACALKQDLRMFSAGDNTEIGERGITLSGGQRQRVALARAVYSRRRILLIDDCLSAVDVRTARHILHRCLLSCDGLLSGRSCVLVTHHVAMCVPHCQAIVVMQNGRVVFNGAPADLKDNVVDLLDCQLDTDSEEASPDDYQDPKSEDEYTAERLAASQHATNSDGLVAGQLIRDEKRVRGALKWKTWGSYFGVAGGPSFLATSIILMVVARTLFVYKDYYLSTKVSLPSDNSAGSLDWLVVYVTIGIISSLVSFGTQVFMYRGGIKVSTVIHSELLDKMIHATPHFIETTPVGRILARFAKDMQIMDEDVMDIAYYFFISVISLITTILMIGANVPLFALTSIFILAAYYNACMRFFLSSREFKRLESTLYAPLLSLYSEMVSGVDSIRAFDMCDAYMVEIIKRLGDHLQADYAMRATRRYLGSRMGTISAFVTFFTTLFVLDKVDTLGSAAAGFILVYAVEFCATSTACVRSYGNLELSLNCVERIDQYISADQEAPSKSSPANTPPPTWPSAGYVVISDLVAGYANNVPVLRKISISISAGEKIGVVGRTGAGKSTLSLAFLRFVEPISGKIEIDGIDISTIGLEDLRQRVTIIPQSPVLFNGTIRFNLDPFGHVSDEILWDALNQTMLTKSTNSNTNSSSGSDIQAFGSLDDEITDNGRNLSLGQRQLVALARALVRRSKLIVMDEATASVDFATDEYMQQTIRGREFSASTVVCIAHRLRTIVDYDRILVLDNGRIVECDTPKNLVQIDGGFFRTLCEESGDFDYLYNLALKGWIGYT